MVRPWIIIGVLATIGLAACDVSYSTSTTVPTTQAEVTAPPATAVVPTTWYVTGTTLAEGEAERPAGYIELPQFGVQFVVPEPFVVVPTNDFEVKASSYPPRGLFTVTACGDCPVDRGPIGDEVHIPDKIDGIPVLLINNFDSDPLAGIERNALIVNQRNLLVIMSLEGDIAPLWSEFLESIRFTEPDPSADP